MCKDEIAHLQTWAAGNNLRLNREKTKEIIFSARRKGALSPPLPGNERVPSFHVLGVTVNGKLTAADHVTTLLSSGTSLLYAMQVLHSHGTRRCTIFSVRRLSRAFSMWCQRGRTCSAADRTHLDSLLRRSKRLSCCSDDVPVVADLFKTADDDFFHRVKTNSDHVLQPFLPDQTNVPYQLRNRSHNITLINKTKFLNDTDFIIRMLYKYSY